MTPTEMLIELDRLMTERKELTAKIDDLRETMLAIKNSGPVPYRLPNGKTWTLLKRRYAAITDLNAIPEGYCTAPDLKRIKEAIDDGLGIPGAEIRESSCYQFRAPKEAEQ